MPRSWMHGALASFAGPPGPAFPLRGRDHSSRVNLRAVFEVDELSNGPALHLNEFHAHAHEALRRFISVMLNQSPRMDPAEGPTGTKSPEWMGAVGFSRR